LIHEGSDVLRAYPVRARELAMPTDLPDRDKDPVVKPPPKTPTSIDNDVILPTPRPSEDLDVILPGDREGGHQAPPLPKGAGIAKA
jgi:hypothetical protein